MKVVDDGDAPQKDRAATCRFERVSFGWQCRGGDNCRHFIIGALPAGYRETEATCPTCGAERKAAAKGGAT